MNNQVNNTKVYTICIILILIMVSIKISAQSITLNSVTEAIDFALNNNPDLEIYRKNQKKAEYDYKSLKNYRLPTISASFSGEDNRELPVTKIPGEIFGQPGTTVEATFGQQYNYNAGITLTKNILDFQSRFSAKIAQVNVEIAEANKDVYKQKLVEQVSLYYFTAIISSKALDVNEKDYKTSEDIFTLIKQKYDEGLVDKNTVNLALMSKNNIVQNINSYKIILEQCLSNLRILFGLEPETEIVFKQNLNIYEMEIPSVDLIEPDKSLVIYKLQVEQSDYIVSQQKTNWFPKLSYSIYNGLQHDRDDFGLSFDSNDWSEISYVSFNISLPIFNKFSTKNKVSSAKIEYDIAQKTLSNEIMKSQIGDKLIIKEFNYSKEAVGSAKENSRMSQENADLQFQKFEQGIISFDKYLESFDDYLKAELAYLKLLLDSYNYYSIILSRNL